MHNPLCSLFHLCCRYSASCHSFRPFRKSCLSNPFPYATLPFATSLAALGSYAYPILSHIFPRLCHHPLLFVILNPLCLISLEPSMLPCLLIILGHSTIFYDTPCLSLFFPVCSMPFLAYWYFLYILLCSIAFSLDLLTGSMYPCGPIAYFPHSCTIACI
jgi:hypothetical protein